MPQAASHTSAPQDAVPPARAQADDGLWAQLADAGDGRAFAGAWLGLQCTMIEGVLAGLVLLEDQTGQSFAPMAVWPDATLDFTHLKDVAEEAAHGARGAVRRDREAAGAPVRIAYPIIIEEHVTGLVVIELAGVDDAGVQEALRRLHWGIGWLEARVLLRRGEEQRARLARAAIALDILSIAGEEQALQGAAMAVVNELSLRFACERAALGLASARGGASARIRLVAMSNTAWFKPGAPLAVSFENLMEEAVDQAATVAEPAIAEIAPAIAVAHRAHREGEGAAALLTVVLSHRGAPVGAVTLERRGGAPFSRDDALTAEAIGEMLGPLFDLKYQQRRLLAGRIPEAAGDAMRAVFGPRRPSLKLGLAAGAAALLFILFFPVAFRIPARAVLEGAQQRAAAAPFQGFIAVANHRAGAVVKRGDVLAELDDKDLRLDQARWRSEYARLLQANRKALAAMDRAEVALVDAQMEQARAQLELASIKLERARITAPIDGVIVSGDWSQKLGAPVEQGTVLFEISPLESFRVTLKIDEVDIGYVKEGQTGTLLLAGRADAALPFTVTRLTSVAGVEDGQNVFRAEASLPSEAQAIRPGMEGVAKIDVGQASVGWVWSRRFIDWLRLFGWRMTP